MPNITHIPEPQPPKRVPITGYDVKTLRKQNEFLLGEIKEREERHVALYSQNRELWKYTENLIEASRVNAHHMKTHLTKLHEELHHSHEIRSDLAARLVIARDSKALIKQIYKQIGQAQFDSSEAERLCHEAERSLQFAKEENDLQEGSLKNKLQHLQLMQWQIDENADREKVDSLMAVAEEYWCTNLTTLRCAYNRFRRGIGRQLRKAKLFDVMRRIYNKYLKTKHFQLLQFYLHKKRIMHSNTIRRGRSCAVRCLIKWKVYTSTERYCKRAHRRTLLRKVFTAWYTCVRDMRFDQWATIATAGFRRKRALHKFFKGWKRHCIFLGWNSRTPRRLALENTAVRHLLGRIVGSWRQVVLQQRIRTRDLLLAAKNLSTLRIFDAWRHSCKAIWQRRGLLLVRFMRNCQMLVEKRAVQSRIVQRACESHINWSSSVSLQRWTRYSHHKLYLQRKVSQFLSLGVFRHRRVLKASLASLQVVAATTRRRHYCFKASIVFHQFRSIRSGFQVWGQHVANDIESRRRSSHKQYRIAIGLWFDLVGRRRQVRKSSATTNIIVQQKARESMRFVLHTMKSEAIRSRRQAYAKKILTQSHKGKLVGNCFLFWRSRWTSVVFGRMKSSRSEADRCKALLGLKMAEFTDLERSRKELAQLAQEQEAKMLLLQSELDNKETLIRDSLELLEIKRVDKKDLEFSLAELQRQLERSQDERRQLSEVEALLIREREKDVALVVEQKREAESLVRVLQEERGVLLGNVHIARQDAEVAARHAVESIRGEEVTLQESEATARAMELLERSKEESVRGLSTSHLGLQQNLEDMQHKLNAVLKEGFSEINYAESQLRQRTSQVRVANSNAGMLEARNAELQRILHEEEEELFQMQSAETKRMENKEMRSMGERAAGGGSGVFEDSYLATHERVQKLAQRLGV